MENVELRVNELEKQAMEGDAKAAFELGIIYEYGEGGIEQDYRKAYVYHEQAADAGIPEAKIETAAIIISGFENDQTEKKASRVIPELRELAEQGYADAMYQLGLVYETGFNTETDDSTAFAWYQKAAVSGCRTAFYRLGIMYYIGRGVSRDRKKAMEYFSKTNDLGLTLCDAACECLYFSDYMADHKAGIELLRKAIATGTKEGLIGGTSALAQCYAIGRGVRRNQHKAEKLFARTDELHQLYNRT